MRATLRTLKLAAGLLAGMALPATAGVSAGQGFENSLGSLLQGFPGGEPLAITAISIALATLLLRLSKLIGLVLTIATIGFVGAALLMAIEPQAFARLMQAFPLS